MLEYLLYQFQYETETFKRALGFLTGENIFLKKRAAEILRNSFDNSVADIAKIFQGRFTTEDELMALLRSDIAEVEELLECNDEMNIEQAGKMIRKLGYNIENTERQFINLRSEFNNFLLETVKNEKK